MREGLRRVSAVFWGWWIVLALLAAATCLWPESRSGISLEYAGMYALGAVLAYGAHRLTCWVIDGFFAGKRA